MLVLGAILLSGCSSHHSIGTWLSSAANTDAITRVSVLSDNSAATYNTASHEAATRCGWKSITTQSIEMECVYLIDPTYTDTYRLTLSGKDTAELYKADRLVTKLVRQIENNKT